MAKKIEVLIQAKNQVAAGIKGATASLKGFSRAASGTASKALGAVGVAMGAVVAAGAKLVGLWDKQVAAVKRLEAVHAAYGDSLDRYMAQEKSAAAAIARETGRTQANTIALMARLRMLGAAPAVLDKATRATYALAAAGMSEERASRAVVMAMGGNYKLLERISPAIRNAKDNTAKLAEFNKLCAAGYKQLEAQMTSVDGATKSLKNQLAGLGAQMGRFVNEGNWVGETLSKVAAAIGKEKDALANALDIRDAAKVNKPLADANREVAALTAQLNAFDSAASTSMKDAASFGEKAKTAFADLQAFFRGRSLKDAALDLGLRMGNADTMRQAIGPMEKEIARLQSMIDFGGMHSEDIKKFEKEIDTLRGRVKMLRDELARRDFAAAQSSGAGAVDAARAALVEKLNAAEERRNAIIRANSEAEFKAEQERRKAQEEDEQAVVRIKELYQRARDAKMEYARVKGAQDELKEAEKVLAALQKADDANKKANAEARKGFEAQLEAAKKLLEEKRKVLDLTIGDARQQKRGDREKEKAAKREGRREARFMKKGERLEKMAAQGAHLTRKQREDLQIFLERREAMNALGNGLAGQNVGNAAQAVAAAQNAIDNLADNIKQRQKAEEQENKRVVEQMEKIQTIKSAIEEMPSLPDLKKETEEIEKKILELKTASNIWQKEFSRLEQEQVDNQAHIIDTINYVEKDMSGLSDYLKKSLESI